MNPRPNRAVFVDALTALCAAIARQRAESIAVRRKHDPPKVSPAAPKRGWAWNLRSCAAEQVNDHRNESGCRMAQYSASPRKPDGSWWESQVERLNLKRRGGELTGPCPHCGGVDRFHVRLRDGLFDCRKCGQFREILEAAGAPGWENGAQDLTNPVTVQANGRAPSARSARQVHSKGRSQLEAAHKWRDPEGQVYARHLRLRNDDGSKSMPWEDASGRPVKPKSFWLYRADAIAGNPGPIYFGEGEKVADRIAALGYLGTTVSGTNPDDVARVDLSQVAGRRCVVAPDNDDKGRQFGTALIAALQNAGAASVSICPPPDGAKRKWDLADESDDDRAREILNQTQPAPTVALDNGKGSFESGTAPAAPTKERRLTELELADAFMESAPSEFKFDPRRGCWRHFDNAVWTQADERAYEALIAILRGLGERSRSLWRYHSVRGALAIAAQHAEMRRAVWDTDDLTLCVPGGWV